MPRHDKLLAKLNSLAKSDLVGNNNYVLHVLDDYLGNNIAIIKSDFLDSKVNAIKTSKRIASIHAELLRALFAYTIKLYNIPKNGFCVCAIGGFGRGEMAPFSDLDLLFLSKDKKPDANLQEAIEFMLYILWDLQLKVGHALRTPRQCVDLANEDETVLSSLLDQKFLAGDINLANKLAALLSKERTRAKKKAFIADKMRARERRHERAGNSRYVIEPNVKEGKGGLRDLHELYWIARFVYGDKNTLSPKTPNSIAQYMKSGLLNKKAVMRFEEACEFLWKVRIHLHYMRGRADEVLSFDKQADMAKLIGYQDASAKTRVEKFMHEYFNITREVGALTRSLCAKLEAENKLLLPQGLNSLLPSARRGLKEPGFVLDNGRLAFLRPISVKENPLLLLHLFRIAGARNLDIHPSAFQTIINSADLVDDDFRKNRQARDIFFQIILQSRAPASILRLMNDAGILGAYIPEFGAIVGRTQFNMYHAYTVDEHIIKLVEYLHDLECGKFAREHPLATDFIGEWSERTRAIVYLACLLHDIGKGYDDQSIAGEKLAFKVCERMSLDKSDIKTVCWLVRNHLLMSDTAQRRDIDDIKTIRDFAKKVGTLTRLQMLSVLTVVDIRAVGAGVWNDWKGELLRQLYYNARQNLLGLENSLKIQIDRQDNIIKTDKKDEVKIKLNRPNDITELVVFTNDRPYLFADLSAAITMCGANIIGAKINTDKDGRVINKFYLQNIQGLAYGRKNRSKLDKIKQMTLNAAKGVRVNFKMTNNLASKRALAIPLKANVKISKHEEGIFLVEVEGRDRVGLLYDLAMVLAKNNVSVRSAHIEVIGPKAVDVFYVRPAPNKKFLSKKLQQDLLSVLDREKTPA